VVRHVPAQKYAVFVHRGLLQGLMQTWHNINESWMPAAGLERADAPDLEAYYDGKFMGDSPESELEIWVPVK
jgi:AraC family transcriptional regulator